MIVRKQKLRLNAEEISLQVSFGLPDVKKAMQKYFRSMERISREFARETPVTEIEMRDYFERDTFSHFEEKYREQLAAWCLSMALRHKFLIASVDENDTQKNYFLSDSLGRRVGRPRNDTNFL